MKKIICIALAFQIGLLAGCTATQTTKGGVVGVDRVQYMFDPLSARDMNIAYAKAYRETVHQAMAQHLLITDSPRGKSLQTIAVRLILQVHTFRPAAEHWNWHLNLIDKPDVVNANCGPGGMIIVYSGLLDRLNLTDDEVAVVIGHEMSHAIREHSREQQSSKAAFEAAGTLSASALGAGAMGKTLITTLLDTGVGLPFSRRDEDEADQMGIELAARAGFDPRASITLWKKMAAQARSSMMPAFLSTHPSDEARIELLSETIPKVMPLYLAAIAAARSSTAAHQ